MKKDIAPNLHHNSQLPISLGCIHCPERNLCGGLQVYGDHYDCLVFCDCPDRRTCTLACPNNLEIYLERHQEVRGFTLENIPRTPSFPVCKLPASLPVIYHASKRITNLNVDAVAVPLSYLFNRKTGTLRFRSREELADHFRFDKAARLVIVGVAQDEPIEDYWAIRGTANIPERLATLRPDLITVPNFSLPLDVVRYDNLHNIKRIAICWSELMLAGIPTALHLNARTDRDWERWTEFILERDEVRSVSFEFATGPARPNWGRWYAAKLITLAASVPRRLQLITRGGYPYLNDLTKAFSEVVFVDTTSFMKTVYRQRLILGGKNEARWIDSRTGDFEPLDELLEQNVNNYRSTILDRASSRGAAVHKQ